jgi:hypothetical protein
MHDNEVSNRRGNGLIGESQGLLGRQAPGEGAADQARRKIPVWVGILVLVGLPAGLIGLFPEGLPAWAFMWSLAVFKTLLGLVELYLLARLVPAEMRYGRGWVGMVGAMTVLHFGLFHVMSCAYRARGINARVLMDAPGYSKSLGEFCMRVRVGRVQVSDGAESKDSRRCLESFGIH